MSFPVPYVRITTVEADRWRNNLLYCDLTKENAKHEIILTQHAYHYTREPTTHFRTASTSTVSWFLSGQREVEIDAGCLPKSRSSSPGCNRPRCGTNRVIEYVDLMNICHSLKTNKSQEQRQEGAFHGPANLPHLASKTNNSTRPGAPLTIHTAEVEIKVWSCSMRGSPDSSFHPSA